MQHLLVATDFSPIADAALARAIAFASRDGAALTLVYAQPDFAATPAMSANESAAIVEWTEASKTMQNDAEASLRERCERALAAGVRSADFATGAGHIDDVIADAVGSLEPDLVVVGTHGRTGILRFVMGSVAEHIVRRSPVSVLVSRGTIGKHADFRRVLVGTDFSPTSDKALRQAIALSAPGAHIEIVHVWQYPASAWGLDVVADSTAALEALRQAMTAGAEERGKALLERWKECGRKLSFALMQGATASALTGRAEATGADLIAVGTHGYRGFRRFLLGSVAEATVRHAPCSVLAAHAEHTEK